MVQLGCTEFGMCIAGLTTKGWVWLAFLSDKRISQKEGKLNATTLLCALCAVFKYTPRGQSIAMR